MQLGKAVKYLIDEEYLHPVRSNQKDFRDYPDVVNFTMLSEAYKVKYLELKKYLKRFKEKINEKYPDIEIISCDLLYNSLSFFDRKELTFSEKLDLKILNLLPSYERILVSKDENGDIIFDEKKSTQKYKKEKAFLEAYKETILELFQEGEKNPIFNNTTFELNTIDNNFKLIAIGRYIKEIATSLDNDILRHACREFNIDYRVNDETKEGICRVNSSFFTINRMFSSKNNEGLANTKLLTDRILLKESEVPEFFKEEVDRRKKLLLKR